jgi:hypothetical protein
LGAPGIESSAELGPARVFIMFQKQFTDVQDA